MKELIESIVKELVDDPEGIDIKEVSGDKITLYELRTSKNDIGKVIGKRGRTAGAIRIILKAVSARQGKRAELEIIEG